MLLRFEFINKKYSDRALSRIVINILESYNIRDRVLVLIINNTSNNLTFLDSFNELLAKFHRQKVVGAQQCSGLGSVLTLLILLR